MAGGNGMTEGTTASFGMLRIADILSDVGFVFMLAWHYLVLFSPIFGDLNGSGEFEYLYMRQLVLYTSLALTFGGVWLYGRFFGEKSEKYSSSAHMVYIAGFFAMAVSGLYAAAASVNFIVGVQLTLVALLGVSEALLMCLWLRCFTNKRGERFFSSFSIDMIAGGMLALLVCCFQWPIGPVVAALAPGLSALVLAREVKLVKPKSGLDIADADDAGKHKRVVGGGVFLRDSFRTCAEC